MNLETWYLYIMTVLILMSTPGPSQLLILSNSLSSGFSRSLFTAAGDLTANLIQMTIATMGAAYLIKSNENLITTIQWLGICYLVIAGILSIKKARAATLSRADAEKNRSNFSLYAQGFLVSAVNPKAVVFFAALFPQFIDPSVSVVPQFSTMSLTYLVMDGLFLSCYALLATLISNWIASHSGAVMKYSPGAILILVAIGLAFKSPHLDY